MRKSALLALLAVMFMAGLAARADEVDDLVKKLNPPRRFEAHKPQWSVKKQDVVFEGRKGPETWQFWFVRDDQRVVAIMPTSGFHGGTLYIQDFRPGEAPTTVPFPKERWHIDTAVGTEIRTNNFIPDPYGTTDESYQWQVDGTRLVLTRVFKGEAKFQRWAHNTKTAVKVDARNVIVFLVDPRLGYVVDATYDIWTDQPPRDYEYSSAATSGRYLLFPGQATCYRHALTRVGSEGYSGYACNHGCTKLHGGESCREGGFVSFLNDVIGWSPTLALTRGGDAKLGVCGAHTDLDFILPWPAGQPRADGLKHNGTPRLRCLALPPELTKYVWDNMKLRHAGEHRLMVRLGQMEDFEEQPLELTTRQRGMPWNAQVSDQVARSGKKSITFSGVSGHGDPQINLRPNTRYVCEAWVKVVDFTAEQRQAADEKLQADIAKATAAAEAAKARGKKPPAIPQFVPAGPAQCVLSGWTYEWSPHVDKPVETYRSDPAGPADHWQKVSFEFTTPAWGPFVQLQFEARNCTVYMDDFYFGPADGKR